MTTPQQSTMTIDQFGTKHWSNINNKLHRIDGPAVEYANGGKYWYLDGKLHRIDGPAVECADGGKEWYVDGKRHRVYGPAIECADGGKYWWLDGKLHRIDGPAVEWADGYKEWYLDGKRLSKKEFDQQNKQMKEAAEQAKMAVNASCCGKIVEIDGKKYKLVEV